MENEFLRVYVTKFNMVALETPGVDAKIKVHTFIQGLGIGSFFDYLVMNEPKDFRDLLERITPYIYLEEARIPRQEEAYMKNKRNPKWQENKGRAKIRTKEGHVRIRQHATPAGEDTIINLGSIILETRLSRVLKRMDMVPRLKLLELCGRCQTWNGFPSPDQLKRCGLWQ